MTIFNPDGFCELCGAKYNLVFHHKDGSRALGKDYINDNEENLMLLCQSCHTKLHINMAKKEKLFNLTLPDKLKEYLVYKSKDQGMSVSAFIRSTLINLMKKDGYIQKNIKEIKPKLIIKTTNSGKRKYLK